MTMEQVRERAEISAEQAADLSALQAAAAVQTLPEQQAEQAAQVQQAQAGDSLAGEFGAVASILLAVLKVPYPSLAPIWTDEAIAATSTAAAAVCVKRGWLADGFMAGYGEEAALLCVAAPLVMASAGAIKADTAKRKPEQPAPVAVAGPVLVPEQPAAATVTIGTVQP